MLLRLVCLTDLILVWSRLKSIQGREPNLGDCIKKTTHVGLVVKVSASRAEDPGFDSHLHCGDFLGSNHTSDLKIGTPVATQPGAWRWRVSAGDGWPSVTILWLGEVEDWSATSVSVWQHVNLSEQIRPWDTLACCWDVRQPTNQETSNIFPLCVRCVTNGHQQLQGSSHVSVWWGLGRGDWEGCKHVSVWWGLGRGDWEGCKHVSVWWWLGRGDWEGCKHVSVWWGLGRGDWEGCKHVSVWWWLGRGDWEGCKHVCLVGCFVFFIQLTRIHSTLRLLACCSVRMLLQKVLRSEPRWTSVFWIRVRD